MKLIDVIKGVGYNPNRGPDGRFASGAGEGAALQQELKALGVTPLQGGGHKRPGPNNTLIDVPPDPRRLVGTVPASGYAKVMAHLSPANGWERLTPYNPSYTGKAFRRGALEVDVSSGFPSGVHHVTITSR